MIYSIIVDTLAKISFNLQVAKAWPPGTNGFIQWKDNGIVIYSDALDPSKFIALPANATTASDFFIMPAFSEIKSGNQFSVGTAQGPPAGAAVKRGFSAQANAALGAMKNAFVSVK